MLDTSSHINWRSEFDRLEGAYAPSTMRAYYADVQAFVDWCQRHGHLPFPADVDTVCAFIEDQGREKSSSTVRRRLYAIRKIHRLLRLEDPTYDEDINLSLRRVRRSKLTRPKQARGITANDLELFLASEPDTPTGLRNRAMMALGFELLTRRSELVALRDEDLTVRPDGTLQVIVRRSKADPFGQGRIAFTSKRTAKLIAEWQAWRGSEVSWLFCPIYKDKPINRELETTTIRRMIKAAVLRSGYTNFDAQEFSGHSLRVGAAQELLKRGHDTAAIMRAGGWKSIQVLARYLEKAEHNVWG